MAKPQRRTGLFGGQLAAAMGQVNKLLQSPKGRKVLPHLAGILPGGMPLMILADAARRAPTPARSRGAPESHRAKPAGRQPAAQPPTKALPPRSAPDPLRDLKAYGRAVAEEAAFNAADLTGRAIGLGAELWDTVTGLGDAGMLISRLQHPQIDVLAGRETAAEQLAKAAYGGILQTIDYGTRIAEDPGKLVSDLQSQAARQAVRLHPDASPRAPTFGGEMARRFEIAKNQGELGFELASFAGGAGALKLTSKLGKVGKLLTAQDYMNMNRNITFAQAKELAKPYTGMGHHNIRRSLVKKYPWLSGLAESPLFLYRPVTTKGQFYEEHFGLDDAFHGTSLRRSPEKLSWSGKKLGMRRYNELERLWRGTTRPMKVLIGSTLGAGQVGSMLPDDE